ncbi:hypothetical protein RFI_27962, partial [Reticulomyxa filosa]
GQNFLFSKNVKKAHAGTAKAAIDALTRHLAVEWGEYNIRVNSVAPGPIEATTGFEKLGGFLFEKQQKNDKDSRRLSAIMQGPIARFGTSKEVADACLFLASDSATYITGICLVVDGGCWMTSSNALGKIISSDPALKKMVFQRKPKKEHSSPKSKLGEGGKKNISKHKELKTFFFLQDMFNFNTKKKLPV